ncbi:hypothetical protein QJS10_CPA03g01164 [Acorus calamus]|uniref:Uncharacterized protein n=1 Tax=Acorus calamus TaxID=4465 RepID=A0AAV9F5D3_ACOCL|nr:hypothetical protein QJS10_CPA03g01164 [Acorus calamus]
MNAMEVDVEHQMPSPNSGPLSNVRFLGMGGVGNAGNKFNLKKLLDLEYLKSFNVYHINNNKKSLE